MRRLHSLCCYLFISFMGCCLSLLSDNQTTTVSPIYSEKHLPFRVSVETADFSLPNGVHSCVIGTYNNKWLILAGRTNGLHGFENNNNNFPPSQQNTVVYVVDPIHKKVKSRSLHSSKSGLTQHQIDLLSVTSPQFYQTVDRLYITGGYGVDTSTGKFSTKNALTAIDMPGLIHWVTHPYHGETASQYIRQTFDPIFQVTGGYMTQIPGHPTLLIFGQNFKGVYLDTSNGRYIEKVRRFNIIDDGFTLRVDKIPPTPEERDPDFRRRDLNVVPTICYRCGSLKEEVVAFSGVFTLSGGIWTIPVTIRGDGTTQTTPAASHHAFKQGMNNYVCPTLGLFGSSSRDMYTIFFGGISYGYFQNGIFLTDSEIPFINQITAIKINEKGHYKQYLLDDEYPVIYSTQSNPGNQLLFGAGAQFITREDLPMFPNGVLDLDKIKKPTFVGYIVGGIQSTLPNTNTASDSAASPYIFKVTLIPK